MTAAQDTDQVYMLTAARWYASRGIPVFPLWWPTEGPDGQLVCACPDPKCDRQAKHPITSHGLNDATTDVAQIDQWWHRHPYANIGLRTGVVFDLLDIDGPDGFASLEKMVAELGGYPHAMSVTESGRVGGGRHYYMQPAGRKALSGGKAGVPKGIDVKGAGGYVVAAPSRHISGQRYNLTVREPSGTVTWDDCYTYLTTREPAPTPPTPAVRRDPFNDDPFSDTRGFGQAVLDRILGEMRAAVEGHRWDTFARDCAFDLGRAIAGGTLDRASSEAALAQAARDVGLSDGEVKRLSELVDNAIRKTTQPITPSPKAKPTVPSYTQQQSDAEPWPTLTPLELDRPDFPTDTLGALEAPVAILAEHLQTPVDLVAMMTLATLSATVRGRVRVTVRDTWSEPLNLYVLVLAGAGETKSPVLSHVTSGLRAMEKRDQEAAKAEVRRYEQKKRLLEGRLAKAEKSAIGASPDAQYSAEIDADMARQALDDLEPVVSPRYLAGDVTAEALVRLLAEQGGALASLSAEGGLFDTLAGGRYSGGMANLDAVLQAHDGREPILVDRKGSDPIRVDRPCLTLGLAVQPQVLQQAGKSDAAEGRGFFARFLFSYPKSRVGQRSMRDRVSLNQGFADIADVLTRLDTFISRSFADIADASPRDDFSLSSLSLETLETYLTALEPRRHPLYGDLAGIGAWANKLDGQIVRLAGLLALTRLSLSETYAISAEPQCVSVDDITNATKIADYLIAHAALAHRVWRGQALTMSDTATQLLGWIREHHRHEFTVKEAFDRLRGRVDFPTAEDVRLAALVLADTGHLRHVVPDTPTAGRPTERYLVNPAALEQA